MKKAIKDLKNYIILVLVGVFAYWGLNNIGYIVNFLNGLFKVFTPFIFGGVIAFALNIIVTKIEDWMDRHFKKISGKRKRFISIVLSLLIFFAVIIFIMFLLIPELIENIELLLRNIPGIVSSGEEFVIDLLDKYPDIQKEISEMFSKNGGASTIISDVLNYIVNGAVGFFSGLISSFITIFTAIIFSIYMLSQKEYLVGGMKKLLYAFCNDDLANRIMDVASLTNRTFNKFIAGQCLEAAILGSLMFVGFTIFRFPYALIIAVLTGITALIPIFGAVVAMIVGIVLIGISEPVKVILFIVVFQVIQQIEGNLIYPKVVGKSVGLSPLWTLLAITVGGNMFGIPGMLLGLPIASVAYSMVRVCVKDRLKEKKIRV